MDDDPTQLRRRWLPWWSAPAGVGLGFVAFAAITIAMIAALLVMTFPLMLCLELPEAERGVGFLAAFALWGAYVLGLPLHDVRRFRRGLALVTTALCVVAVVAACTRNDGVLVIVGLFFGVISHGMLVIAVACLRQSNRMVDPRRWAGDRLAHGLCPHCGYDIRGLPESRCPECGMTWSAEEMGDEVGESAGTPRLP
jgi:hypothetical protein